LELDEWACELDKARGEVCVYQKHEKRGSYKLITSLGSYCNKCMHPCIDESLCYWHQSGEQIDKTFAIGIYYPYEMVRTNLMTYHLLQLKNNKEFAKPLSCAMIECLRNGIFPDLEFRNIDYIVPVPKHPDEFKIDVHTGEKYNQAEVIARYVAKSLEIELIDALRKRACFSLRNLGKEERKSLALANYDVVQEIGEKLRDKNVLLIDDIRTSGSTGHACARCLKSVGAIKVYLYVAGRSVIAEVVEKCLV